MLFFASHRLSLRSQSYFLLPTAPLKSKSRPINGNFFIEGSNFQFSSIVCYYDVSRSFHVVSSVSKHTFTLTCTTLLYLQLFSYGCIAQSILSSCVCKYWSASVIYLQHLFSQFIQTIIHNVMVSHSHCVSHLKSLPLWPLFCLPHGLHVWLLNYFYKY